MAASIVPLPPRIRGEGPTLQTVHQVERVLRNSNVPLSLKQIRDELPRRVERAYVQLAIDHYARLGFVVEGSKGAQCLRETGPAVRRVVEKWKRL